MAKKDKNTITETASIAATAATAAAAAKVENKKRKRDKKGESTVVAPTKTTISTGGVEGFSLFGKIQDVELEDVFSKGAAFARPVEKTTLNTPSLPVASSSKGVTSAQTSASSSSKKTKMAKSTDKEPGLKAVSVVTKPSDAEEAEKSLANAEVENVEDDDAEEEDQGQNDDGEEDAEDDDDIDEDDDEDLTHEAVKNAPKKVKVKSNVKYVPPGETALERDQRTVFVGNLPIEIAKSKSVEHQLRSHLQTFAPTSKIESIRYRSVAFAQPTADLPTDDADKDQARRAKREKERVAAWKASQEEDGGIGKGKGKGKRGAETDDAVERPKVFLDEKAKRKVAFIKKDFHSELESCNAYVVFAYPHPERPSNVAPIMNPQKAAQSVLQANGTTFLDRTIRVDVLRLPSSVALANATTALTKRDAWLPSGTDPKKSLFVGGLDYAAKDEDLRVFFEELVKAERGPCTSEAGRWVVGVRLIRDRETQLGKGFGYVHFSDRESADEILALDSKKLKFAKKPLRVQPCKTLPPSTTMKKPIIANGSNSHAPNNHQITTIKSKTSQQTPMPMPKGNPLLGEKIKDLPKDERKLVKATDAERQARRLAKKKLRGGMEKDSRSSGAVKVTLGRGDKERSFKAPKAKKGRVRSGNALKKMKGSRV